MTACRDVERNALRAGLVPRAEAWRWGSLWAATQGPDSVSEELPALSAWPIERPADWVERVNAAFGLVEEEALRRSLRRGQPFGTPEWQDRTATRLCLESTLRPRGRPRKDARIGS
jgi:putative transposase